MNNHLILIFLFHLFPGRNDQDIIHIKLLKILLPVINPVNIFCLIHENTSFSNLTEHSETIQLFPHRCENFLLCRRRSIQHKSALFIFFHKKTEIGNSIILRTFRKDIHKHLLFLHSRQRNLVFNLGSFQSNIIKRTDNNIFCLCYCLYLKFLPFHLQNTPFSSKCQVPDTIHKRIVTEILQKCKNNKKYRNC